MKRILYFVFWVIFCTSCGNFLEEYSQDLVYAQSCEDLDVMAIWHNQQLHLILVMAIKLSIILIYT